MERLLLAVAVVIGVPADQRKKLKNKPKKKKLYNKKYQNKN
jgi:hypothetical protein